MRIDIEVSSYNNGKLKWTESPETFRPQAHPADSQGIGDLASLPSRYAISCMYCGSKANPRTREHIVPHSLGGTLVVHRGSCVECQEKAKRFETQVFRGQMANVRYAKGMPSSSKHEGATDVEFTVVGDQASQVVRVPAHMAPILLTFPVFPLPKMCSGTNDAELDLIGTVTAAFGTDPRTLMSQHPGKKLLLNDHVRPVPFAQCIAKIAFGMAWVLDIHRIVPELGLLARAFLDKPESLGRFVGTEAAPLQLHSGLHRVGALRAVGDVLCMEVQLFADCGAPTYLVALGRLDMNSPYTQHVLRHLTANQ